MWRPGITTAQITGVSGSCVLQKKKNAVLVTVNTAFLADNGPANNSAPLTLPWFAAITSGDNIIQKTDYTLNMAFNGNVSTVGGTAKPIKVEMPNTPATANIGDPRRLRADAGPARLCRGPSECRALKSWGPLN